MKRPLYLLRYDCLIMKGFFHFHEHLFCVNSDNLSGWNNFGICHNWMAFQLHFCCEKIWQISADPERTKTLKYQKFKNTNFWKQNIKYFNKKANCIKIPKIIKHQNGVNFYNFGNMYSSDPYRWHCSLIWVYLESLK